MTRISDGVKAREASQKKLDALVEAARKTRDEFAAAGADVYPADPDPRTGNVSLYSVETGRRVGIVTGRDGKHLEQRVAEVLAERKARNEAAAEAAAAEAKASKQTNANIKAKALAALGGGKKTTETPKAEETA